MEADLTAPLEAPGAVQLCDPSAIAEQMRAGDLAALDRVTRCYGERLLAVGRRACRDDDAARDAVQDALLAAGEHLEDLRAVNSPEGWLVRLVTNACYRMRRGRKNDPALHRDAADVPLGTTAPSPEVLAGRGQLAVALGEAMLALSPTDRAILLFAEAEDWRAPEIAAHLGLTPAAVRKRLSRARAALRPALAQHAPDPRP